MASSARDLADNRHLPADNCTKTEELETFLSLSSVAADADITSARDRPAAAHAMYLDLLLNLALLVAITVLSGFVAKRWRYGTRRGAAVQGLLFGAAAILGMMRPFVLVPGLIFDGRSIVLSLAALFFGPVTAGVSVSLTAAYRLWLAGPGATMGVLTALVSGGLGLYFRARWGRQPGEPSAAQLLLVGVVVNAAVLGLTVTLREGGADTARQIALPFLVIFPLATVVIGGVLADQRSAARALDATRLQSAALNAAANAVVITDRHGTIVWANPAFTTLTGYEAGEAVGRNPRDLLKSGQHEGEFYRDMWETLLAGEVWSGEVTNRRKDGSHYLEDQTITPVRDSAGDITHFIAIKRDLTRQRQLEEQFVQAQKMESVGRMAAGLAHDFNNVLTVVRGTADLLGLGLPPRDARQADVDQIRRAADRAAALTRQLLAVSRKQILQPVVVDLSQLVRDMTDMLRRMVGEDIELGLRVPERLGRIKADPSQLEQVLMNLAANARDAMPDGGHLAIELRDVEVPAGEASEDLGVAPGTYVLMTVADDGPGMDDETRARAFEPFFTTRSPAHNSGLGLATVYGIVKQSGGYVTLSSRLGEGTTFRLYWPRVEAPVAAAVTAPVTSVATGSETLVLVEDQAALRELGERVLCGAGYRVLPAAGGEEALRLLEQHRGQVDLMITDVVMPGMSGPQLSMHVAREHPTVRVLFMSGYTDDGALRDGLADHTAHFIAKPYTVQDLTQKVRQVLDAPA